MLGQAMPHLDQLPASGNGHRTGAMHEYRPCAASLMRPLTSDGGGFVDIGRPRPGRRWSVHSSRSAASSQRALTVTTIATFLSDQPRPCTSGLLETASASGRSLNADTFEYSGLFSSAPSLISTAQSEHGTSGSGWVSLATHLDTHLELELTKSAVQWPHATRSRRSSSSTVKVGLAQIVALVQQGERERKAHHAAAALLYDLERWNFVNHWVEGQSKRTRSSASAGLAAAVVTQTTKPERTASSSSTGGPSVCGSTAAVRSLPGHLPLEHPSRGAAQSRYALNSSAVPSDDSAPSNASSFGESQCEGSQSTEGTSSLGAVHWLGPLEASELDPKEIELHECIGSSSNGSVYRGMWMGVGVAVKYFQPPMAVPPRNADPACTTDPKSALHPVDSCERDFLHEAQLLHELRHPNVLLFIGVLTKPRLALVTEYMPRASLYSQLHLRGLGRQHQAIDTRRRMRMALDIARGMMYLHSRHIVHCDLKTANLLVDKNWLVKVCDFGLSRKLSGGLADGLNSMQGTPRYMAPELLRRLMAPETLCNEPVTPQMDVYSFGVVVWELFTGQEPWKGFTVKLVLQMVELQKTNLLEVTPLDDGVGALIARCLNYDPNLRPCFSEIVRELQPLVKTLDTEHHVSMRQSGPSLNKGVHSRRASEDVSRGSSRNTSRASSRASSPIRTVASESQATDGDGRMAGAPGAAGDDAGAGQEESGQSGSQLAGGDRSRATARADGGAHVSRRMSGAGPSPLSTAVERSAGSPAEGPAVFADVVSEAATKREEMAGSRPKLEGAPPPHPRGADAESTSHLLAPKPDTTLLRKEPKPQSPLRRVSYAAPDAE